MNGEGTTVNTRGQCDDHQNMSYLYLRYERLRWIFIEEFPTVGCEVLAVGNDNLCINVRDENIWAMRNAGDKRQWGGINLGCTEDFWQFRPVNPPPSSMIPSTCTKVLPRNEF